MRKLCIRLPEPLPNPRCNLFYLIVIERELREAAQYLAKLLGKRLPPFVEGTYLTREIPVVKFAWDVLTSPKENANFLPCPPVCWLGPVYHSFCLPYNFFLYAS